MVKLLVFISFIFILMTLTLFYIIKGIIDSIKEKSKLYFAVKIEEYEELKKKREDDDNQVNKIKRDNLVENSDVNEDFVYVENSNDYEVEDLFQLTKIVDDNFSINSKDLIINFINQNVNFKNSDLFNELLELKCDIDEVGVYGLITDLSKREDFIYRLKTKYHKIYSDYCVNDNKFDINDFVSYVESMINENNPNIYILVGTEEENYDKIDDRIRTIYDSSIYKGFKIIYKNKLYDYSLS